MRSGWPHTQDDHGRLPADQRQQPFGPEISWPTGYSNLEYRDGDYRYPAPPAAHPPAAYPPAAHPAAALPPVNHGEHPYAAFSAAGYGDDGYRNPGYDGPAAQDAGIAGTRTVRGFVEPGQPGGYAQPGYAPPALPGNGYGQPGYAAPGYGGAHQIESAYPAPQAHREQPGYQGTEEYQPAASYRQPWDYDQPLRYDGEEPSYPGGDGYGHSDGYGSGTYSAPVSYENRPYDPAEYNGSAYSRPGIDGPGYDLSGIIGTGDFEAFSYDEPSYDRLSYDDPRYDDTPGYGDSRGGPRYDETRFDMPRYDETRLDRLWLSDEDVRHDDAVGYENDGFGTDSPPRSGYSGFDQGSSARFDETRLDLNARDLRMDHTRFDVPAFDETRIDNMRAVGPAGLRQSATGLLAPPESRPMSWAEETSLDSFSHLDLDEVPAQAPAAFVRTAERHREDDDTGARRAVGRRRGRSGDRRQWMALGAIAVVAAGAIGGVLMKYVFSGPSGPAHTVVAPNSVDGFTRMPNLEKQMKVDALRNDVMKTSAGQATNVHSAVYELGNAASGGNAQIFMFVGGNLSSADPATSVQNFTQTYRGAQLVPPGSLGGQAACAEAQSGGESVAMCVWFDNDSFGELVSPSMTTAKLATTLDQVRPSLELYAK